MVDRLQQLSRQLASSSPAPHPFDPLTGPEIEYAVAVVRREYGQIGFNAVTLAEPKKKEMLAWLADQNTQRPRRQAEVVAIGKDAALYDGIVDLKNGKILTWEKLEGVQPLVSICRTCALDTC
jgi:primary-amine oxidase